MDPTLEYSIVKLILIYPVPLFTATGTTYPDRHQIMCLARSLTVTDCRQEALYPRSYVRPVVRQEATFSRVDDSAHLLYLLSSMNGSTVAVDRKEKPQPYVNNTQRNNG
jgi:hypothetical protein